MNDLSIDYSFTTKFAHKHLLENHYLPALEDQFYILVYVSALTNNDALLQLQFSKPIKTKNIDSQKLSEELLFLPLREKLDFLARKSLDTDHQVVHNSYLVEFLDFLIQSATALNASDIHIEVFELDLFIRVRIDGVLIVLFRFGKIFFNSLSAILKYFANLDIAQKRLPLNGRFTRVIENISYDCRVSTMPTIYNESLVLRILQEESFKTNLETIGFDHRTKTLIQSNLAKNQGLILVTGPTGSGKTTTLYAALNYLNSLEKKIISIEDPVEYRIDGIVQVGLHEELGLDYHKILKNILRQDPDVIMIGEIRDSNSLQSAIQAALTGHLVIATLHTNDAVETIFRLLDLQAQPFLISTTLKMVLAQRLVRRLCDDCKIYDKQNKLFLKKGCKNCHYTGYKNRIVVTEVLNIDQDIAQAIQKRYDKTTIVEIAQKNGFELLQDCAKRLLLQGLTTQEEIVARIDNVL
ncbi:MAG: type II/IV secretion system protein [Campylobacterales bacterium]|nr:type II/IV secretion system protein [Campylobacterales bacterium]